MAGEPKYFRPVVRLLRALYGHPDAGTCWEEHCDKQLTGIGFEPIEQWSSCYWLMKEKILLTVYVDDFKLSGPADGVDRGWKLIRSVLNVEDPQPAGLYLGVHT